MNARQGYSHKELSDAICRNVMSGQTTAVFHLLTVKTPEKNYKASKKALQSSENWCLKNSTVYNVYGICIHGLASWGNSLTVRMNEIDYRFKVLHLDRFGQRFVYAIPVHLLGNVKKLPRIMLSRDEIDLILDMANELRTTDSDQEILVYLKSPARNTIKNRVDAWKSVELKQDDLLALLEGFPVLIDIVVTALDAQLRSFKRLSNAPVGICNFLLPSGDTEASSWLLTVLGALTFSSETGPISQGPILIQLNEKTDLKRWELCIDHLTIIRATGSQLRPLQKQLEENERIQKSGGDLRWQYPTLPLTLTKSALHCPNAIDIKLPEEACPLMDEQLDLLRKAMSLLLCRTIAKVAYHDWKAIMDSPTSYRLSSLTVWRSMLTKQVLSTWFPSEPLSSRANLLCLSLRKQHEAEIAERDEILRQAFALLSDPQTIPAKS